MRPAQRVSTQRSVKVNFLIDVDMINTLLQPWLPHAQGMGIKDLSLAEPELKPDSEAIIYQFYPSNNAKSESKDKSKLDDPNAANFSQEEIHISDPFTKGNKPTEILFNIIKEYNIPELYHYDLFHKIRIAAYIKQPEMRSRLLSIRFLAISICCFITNDTIANKNIFSFEPTFIADLVNILLQKESSSLGLQTAALQALDSIAHFPGKMNDVLTTISANASHGALISLLKRVLSLEDINGNYFSFIPVLLYSNVNFRSQIYAVC